MKKIYMILSSMILLSLVGCSQIDKKDSKEDTKKEIDIGITYPQSIKYFKTINELEKNDDSDNAKVLLEGLQRYITENYPYDYSQAKDDAMLDKVEDFGLMERFLITNNSHMFYEATNNTSTISLNYYVKEENDVRSNSVAITTEDFGLHEKICKNHDEELGLHNVYEDIIKLFEKKKDINAEKIIKELEGISNDFEKKEMVDGVVFYRFVKDDENLTVTYSSDENKITNLGYRNNSDENLTYETVSLSDDGVELNIMLNKVDSIYYQKELFDKVIK